MIILNRSISFYLFLLKINYSLIYSLPQFLSHFPLPPDPLSCFSSERSRHSRNNNQTWKKQDIRLGKSLHSCQARATQPNRRKRVLRAGKVEGDKPVPTVMSSTKHEGTSKNICRRTGVDTDRCLVASSVSVSPNELCLFDLVGHDILVSSMSSDSYHLFPSLTRSFSSSELRYPIKSFIFKSSLAIM